MSGETTLRDRLASFSIVSGGALSRGLAACRLGGMSRGDVARRCVALMTVGWLPLLLVAIAQGAVGSFTRDVGTHVRLLLALPLLVIAERAIELRSREALAHLAESEIVVDEHAEKVERALALARRMRDSGWVDLGLLAGVVALSVNDFVHLASMADWMFVDDAAGRPTPTVGGWLELAVAAPLYRMLVLRWLWRWVVWVVLLGGLARCELRLSALHVDEVGGLGVLAEAHSSCGWILGALGVTLAGNFTMQRLLLHNTVAAYTHSIALFCIVAPALCLAPLLAFAWPLELARRRAHRDYAVVGADFARRYAQKHLDGPAPIRVGSADPSTAEDLGGSFERMRATRALAMERKQYLFLFACAFAPMVPFYLQELPMAEIVERLRHVL